MKKILYSYLVALILSLSMLSASFAADNSSQAIDILTSFLQNEYNGRVDQRMEYSAFHSKGKLLYGNSLNEYTLPGVIIDLTSDKLIIVSDYKIENYVFKNKKYVIFSVLFNVIGKTKGFGYNEREILFTQKSTEHIKYHLRLTDQGWKIYNPPIARVSMEALKTQFEYQMSMGCDKWLLRHKKGLPSEIIGSVCPHYYNELTKIKSYLGITN